MPKPVTTARLQAVQDYLAPLNASGALAAMDGAFWYCAADPSMTSSVYDFVGNKSNVVVNGNSQYVLSPLKDHCIRFPGGLAGQRFEARQGDVAPLDEGRSQAYNRCELVGNAARAYRQTFWWSYAMRLTGPGVGITGQIHHTENANLASEVSPPLLIYSDSANELRIDVRASNAIPLTSTPPATKLWSVSPIPYGQTLQFVHQISLDPTAGMINSWLNGMQIISQPTIPFGYAADTGFREQHGIYRPDSPDTLIAEYANYEFGTVDLSSRIASPLALPAGF